jgi:hypothetical protein
MTIPPDLPDNASRADHKRVTNDILAVLRELVGDNETPAAKPTLSPLTPKAAYTVGETRPVPASDSLVDVFDGQGWQRMRRDYYEANYGDCEQPQAAPPVSEETGE